MANPDSSERRIRLGVSSCLLGEKVRYDGGHKRDRFLSDGFLSDELGALIEWVPVCPEVEAGMGVPRPPVRLVRRGNSVAMLEVESGRDHTRTLKRFALRRVRELRALDLCGYVLKSDSPSCGFEGVKVHDEKGEFRREGVGLYAAALREVYPHLPVEDEGRLHDPAVRENFVARILAYRELRD